MVVFFGAVDMVTERWWMGQTEKRRVKQLLLAVLANLILAVAVHLVFGDWLGWSSPIRDTLPDWLGDGLPFLQFMALSCILDRALMLMIERVAEEQRVPKLALQLLSSLIYFGFLGASIGVVFHRSVSAVLAASGIAGLAVGLALRGLLADVFSGIALNLDAGLRSGDWLDLTLRGREYSCRLVDIHWRTVVLADRAENQVFIPNSEFTMASIVNRSRPGPASEYKVLLPLPIQHDRARVCAVLENALTSCAEAGWVLPSPVPYVRVGDIDPMAGTLTYRLYYCQDMTRVSPVRAKSEVTSRAVDFLKAANLRLQVIRPVENSRPTAPGSSRFSEAGARLGVLSDVPLLSVLSPWELAQLSELSEVRTVPAGQYAMRAGDDGTSMLVVLEGRLRVMRDGNRVATLWPGECAGEMSLLTGSPRSADVQADGAVTVLEIPKQALTPILKANPHQVERLAVVAAERQAAANPNAAPLIIRVDDADARSLINTIRRFFRLGG